MYSKHGELESSRALFNQMTRKSLVSWTAMISGYLQNGHPRETMDLFMEVWISENYFLDSAIVLMLLLLLERLLLSNFANSFIVIQLKLVLTVIDQFKIVL